MMMTTSGNRASALAFDETPSETDMVLEKLEHPEADRIELSAVTALTRSEIEMQLDAAHKYPREIKRFVDEALTLATLSQAVAASCIYTLKRSDKPIVGPSVRLAEIVASAYGNLHVVARVVDVETTVVVAQGAAWDLEKNLRATIEVRRRITNRDGNRYNDDMITVTGNAAASVALRNAIFRVVPRAYIDIIYAKVREVAVGTARTLEQRRGAVLANFAKLGVPEQRVLAAVQKASVMDVDLEALEVLVGLGTAIRGGDMRVDEAFPAAPGTRAEPQATVRTDGASQAAAASSDVKKVDLQERVRRAATARTAAQVAVAAAAGQAQVPPATPAPTAAASAAAVSAPAPKGAPAQKGAPEPAEPCSICGAPLGADDHVQTTDNEGVIGHRHMGCSPFGLPMREPGDD